MAKRRRKTVAAIKSPLEVAAQDSVTPETRARNAYKLTRYAERDYEGGVSLNGMRLERLACVKALEGLARKHAKRKTAFLESYHLMAASAYQGDLLAMEGHRNSAYRERIDVSSSGDGGLVRRLDAAQRLSYITSKLPDEELATLDVIITKMPENSMAEIWPGRTDRNKARDVLKGGLHKLAVIYGLVRT